MNVVFVCQRGELELKAMLLAWSLRVTHGDQVKLIAACPDYRDWNQLDEKTGRLMSQLDVERVTFASPFGDEYPIGNKVAALGLLPPDQPGCFLDSDMLSLEQWSLDDLLGSGNNAAKPADFATWGAVESWQDVYTSLGQPMPDRKVRTTVSGKLSLPYFNAGVVASRIPQLLSEAWLGFTRQLHLKQPPLPNLYPWLDQITLPASMQSAGGWTVLTEQHNFPAHVRPMADLPVSLCHYHHPGVLLREPRLFSIFLRATREFPELLEMASGFPEWKTLILAVKAKAGDEGFNPPEILVPPSVSLPRDFLITGIPRSGTSYLCSLLDAQKDWLVINEPAEIFDHLYGRPDASGIALCHMEYRQRILQGLPVQNKVDAGKVVSDTAQRDERVWYTPDIQRGDFWLGSKNTLAYISALDHLTKLDWPIIAMVRHPLDSLASWRSTFGHLREAQVDQITVTNPEYGGWRNWQRQALLEISVQSDSAVRRVLLWRLLARTLINARENLFLWRYEDLVADPATHIEQINRRMNYMLMEEPVKSNLRARTKHYDAQERDLLADLCRDELEAFNYKL